MDTRPTSPHLHTPAWSAERLAACLDSRAKARLAVSVIAAEAAKYATALVPTVGDEHLVRGELQACAKRLRALSLAFDDAVLRYERVTGTPWETLAGAMDADVFAGEHPDAADETSVMEASRDVVGDDPLAVARDLDAWYARTAAPLHGEPPPSDAVTVGLLRPA